MLCCVEAFKVVSNTIDDCDILLVCPLIRSNGSFRRLIIDADDENVSVDDVMLQKQEKNTSVSRISCLVTFQQIPA